MKTLTYVSTIALTAALTLPAQADDKKKFDGKHFGTFAASAIAGAAIGGPIGMFFGALGGGFMADKNQETFEKKEVLEKEVAVLTEEVHNMDVTLTDLENRVAQKLEFQVMFATGDDDISFQDSQRISSLSQHLLNNPELKVRLDGHADPRGTDEYNNVLSQERAKAVASQLIEAGIEPSRIEVHSHGATLATTIAKDSSAFSLDQFALERRVHIEVFSPSETVANNP